MRKFAKVYILSFLSRSCSIFNVGKHSEKNFFSLNYYSAPPLTCFFMPTNSCISRFIVLLESLVHVVLRCSTFAKVINSAIQRFSIFVVYMGRCCIYKFPMKINAMRFRTSSAPCSIKSSCGLPKLCIPVPLHCPFISIGVHDDELSSCKRYVSYRWIIRLLKNWTWFRISHDGVIIPSSWGINKENIYASI